jgi:hypothetical protein
MNDGVNDMNEAPRIWTRRPKIIEPRDPVTLGIGMAGFFRLRVRRPDGRCRLDTGFFPNLITNLGLNWPGASATYSSISVGTGNTTPDVTDTNLVARVATTSTDTGASGYTASVGTPGDPDWYTAYTLSLRFAQGAAEGNLAEIGVTTAGTPWNCYSRALILDSDGNPTTITVLEDEFLDATYEHRWYAGSVLTDVEDTISISGNDHDIVLRRCEVDGGLNCWRPNWGWNAGVITGSGMITCHAYNGAIGATTASPAGTSDQCSTQSNSGSYTTDTHYRDFSAQFGLDRGNLSGGISAMRVRCGSGRIAPGSGGSDSACYQFSLDPVINKTSSQLLTMNFRQTWARRTL